jgi:hypothetical protein
VPGTYFTLYVILDIFSRYIVGWQVAARESAAVAQELIYACCTQQGVVRGQLTVHADRRLADDCEVDGAALRRPRHRQEPFSLAAWRQDATKSDALKR